LLRKVYFIHGKLSMVQRKMEKGNNKILQMAGFFLLLQQF